ncbi:MAG TPA: S26 family signal peptidase [Fimbriiglobus sp.]|nr:S26 family signal peptidase [Fimbriiglobus sp.]
MATVPQKSSSITAPGDKTKPKAQPRDSVREVVETIVFVVALVLMLKLFVVEAFVIPTGSMAETLLGYNKLVTCPECGFEFPVNSSDEVDPQDGVRRPVTGATCPNCRTKFTMSEAKNPSNRSGDRVLVHKALYHFTDPHRGNVVVFKFPVDPQVQHTAQNYIKRLWGLGGETIAIHSGDLYVCHTLDYPGCPRPSPAEMDRIWEGPEASEHSKTDPRFRSLGVDFTYHNVELALKAFDESSQAGFPAGGAGFELIRKPDDLALSMRRIVYDNDYQSRNLAVRGVRPRWTANGGGWSANDAAMPKVFTHAGDDFGWVRYAHRLPVEAAVDGFGRQPMADAWSRQAHGQTEGPVAPAPITNFLGYNAGEGGQSRMTGDYWVGDLMVECEAKVSGPGDEVVLELAEGVHRFQARFKGGAVTLVRVGAGGELVTKPTPITDGGTYKLRFANFDSRLRVWVDGKAIDFGSAADYAPWAPNGAQSGLGALAAVAAVTGAALTAPQPDGHTIPNDVLAPAGIGAKGAVEVSHVKLWMDTYFTPARNHNSNYAGTDNDPDSPVDTFYVQPGHYFCLGDNSGQSSDSRKWGLVPERLMLGRAVFVFFPLDRIGFIR